MSSDSSDLKEPPTEFVEVEGQNQYYVVGNHPVLARPDKYSLTFNEAVAYSEELCAAGFEGVTIHEQR